MFIVQSFHPHLLIFGGKLVSLLCGGGMLFGGEATNFCEWKTATARKIFFLLAVHVLCKEIERERKNPNVITVSHGKNASKKVTNRW